MNLFEYLPDVIEGSILNEYVGGKWEVEYFPFGDGEQTYSTWTKKFSWQAVCKPWLLLAQSGD